MGVDTTRPTSRLNAVVVLAICICATGILLQNRLIVTATIVPIGYLLYGQLTRAAPLDVAVERSLSEQTPAPGEHVDVTVTVTNTSPRTIPKLHVVDGVPPELGVAQGTPRHATALRPGEATSITYTVIARRGTHEFTDTYLNSQSFSGTEERERGVTASGGSQVTCHAIVSDPVEREVTHQYAGQVATDDGGTGLEFYAIREHQHGDPVSRIDWNRYAKTKELTTVTYRERKGAPVVIVVDLRSEIDVARRPIDPPASELNLYAAHRLLEPLFTYGNKVGLAFYTGDRIEWLAPNRGSSHETRVEMAMREASDGDWSQNTTTLQTHGIWKDQRTEPVTARADGTGSVQRVFTRLDDQLSATTNFLLVTPVLDSFPEQVIESAGALSHDVAVLSPNVVARTTPGGRVAALDRQTAITRLRRAGTTVISWDPDDPLGEAIARTLHWRDGGE